MNMNTLRLQSMYASRQMLIQATLAPPPPSPVVEYNRVHVKMIINRKMYKYNPEYVGDISGAGSLTTH